jgi:hypothetical protein
VTWGINNGNVVLWSFELPEGNINGNTSFTFGLKFIKTPGVLEGTLTKISRFLFELLYGTLIDTTTLVI